VELGTPSAWRRGRGLSAAGELPTPAGSAFEAETTTLRALCPVYYTHFACIHYFKMTTYIPSLTLPSAIFENAALSVLFPIVAGTAVGFSTQRKDRETTIIYSS
jgi:hypothetical protein